MDGFNTQIRQTKRQIHPPSGTDNDLCESKGQQNGFFFSPSLLVSEFRPGRRVSLCGHGFPARYACAGTGKASSSFVGGRRHRKRLATHPAFHRL